MRFVKDPTQTAQNALSLRILLAAEGQQTISPIRLSQSVFVDLPQGVQVNGLKG